MISSPAAELGLVPSLLVGRTAVVTGAGDIGAVVARELVRHGAIVEVWDRSAPALDRVGEICRGGVTTRRVDTTSWPELEAATHDTVGKLGTVDVLVNTAAVLTFSPVAEMDPDVWRETIEVNLTGVFLSCRAIVGHMISNGRGSIITISSVAGLRGEPDLSHYSASKFGVIGLTQSLAREAGPFGVRANCVSPGAIASAMNTETLASAARRLGASVEESERQVIARTPLRRLGEPLDVANVVVFLASDLASFVTGQTIAVTGGIN